MSAQEVNTMILPAHVNLYMAGAHFEGSPFEGPWLLLSEDMQERAVSAAEELGLIENVLTCGPPGDPAEGSESGWTLTPALTALGYKVAKSLWAPLVNNPQAKSVLPDTLGTIN